MTSDEHLDKAYTYAESIITWLSWIVGFGIYPIASEAFGVRKPWVTRGIGLLTIVWYLAVYIYPANADRSRENLMLWGGDATETRALIATELTHEGATPAQVEATLAEIGPIGEFHAYQLFTHALLHGGILHLAGNLLFLFVFGSRVNALIGNILTAILYPLLAAAAGVAHLISVAHDTSHPALGASGAIMGLAGMYLVLFPVHKVHVAYWLRWGLFFGFSLNMKIFAVRGFWIVLFYIAFDVFFTVFGLKSDVAHWAHLGGFITGIVIALGLLIARLVNARGGDIVSAVLGRHAWGLIGRPNRPAITLW